MTSDNILLTHNKPRLWKSKKFRQRVSTTISTILIALGSFVILIPIAWMLSTSLKTQHNILALPPQWIPKESLKREVDGKDLFMYEVDIDGEIKNLAAKKLDPEESIFINPDNPSEEYILPIDKAQKMKVVNVHWDNYKEAWTFSTTPFATFMKNTTAYALLAVFAEVLVNGFVAYGFARLRAPGKNFWFILILGTLMLPWAVTMIPSYVLFTRYIPDFLSSILDKKVVWADTWWPLYIPKFFGSAYLIFLIRQFYMGIPQDYADAARIDGCGYFQTWWRIMLPMSRPVLTAVAILSFMYHWNDYMGPLIYLNSTEKLPLSVGLANFQAAYGGTPWHLMMAAALIAVIPLVIIFFALNRYFIQGIVVSGIKG